MNAPRVGGSFAVWGGLFSTFDCTMVYVRQKEDPWNSIISGAATGGFLQMRQGLGPATRSAIFGGVLLAMIEGAGIVLGKFLSDQQQIPVMIEEAPQPAPNDSSPSWFGGLFGGKQEEQIPKVIHSQLSSLSYLLMFENNKQGMQVIILEILRKMYGNLMSPLFEELKDNEQLDEGNLRGLQSLRIALNLDFELLKSINDSNKSF
ncbi:hypothetical protein L2E82_19603 [Cichorium intybus]|uniref:Uncharacterized protein n=1 Tax=Cichorium intybus TaxID=13427 RepID=A0ACB9FD28_CICIN|nr:hypothetical protein L2E82_19603 [Cichorium intybus]